MTSDKTTRDENHDRFTMPRQLGFEVTVERVIELAHPECRVSSLPRGALMVTAKGAHYERGEPRTQSVTKARAAHSMAVRTAILNARPPVSNAFAPSSMLLLTSATTPTCAPRARASTARWP